MPLESFLACHTAKMVGFTLIGDFEFSCVFIKNHAADGVSKHYGSLNLMEHSTFLPIMDSGQKQHQRS
jgi:hypothetical protein